MPKPIALVDLEGVLFPEMWPAIAAAIGDPRLEVTTREVADYPILMTQRLKLLRSNGVQLADVQEIVTGLSFLPGAIDFIEALKSFAEVVIVTDSFAPMNDSALEALSVSRVFTNHLTVDYHGFAADCFYWHMGCGKERVYEFLHERQSPVLAIGDGFNDLAMLRLADLGILYDPSDMTLRSAGELLVLRNLEQVLRKFSAFAEVYA
ncbi:MAG: bifunctional phosphoserine phosphatase/homoserine phosphotransferase ThrH [Verrucomicrobia bacterium]|jgi:phosphoserine/homoserine phosphotransferase|nr:bifunctional phosphoserine phosphatase/homoserine phosphotransferase ThrH [Verrucomicrobiota bacterium]